MFFARHVAANPAMRLATREVAAAFCLEVPCDDLARSPTIGINNSRNDDNAQKDVSSDEGNQVQPVSNAKTFDALTIDDGDGRALCSELECHSYLVPPSSLSSHLFVSDWSPYLYLQTAVRQNDKEHHFNEQDALCLARCVVLQSPSSGQAMV